MCTCSVSFGWHIFSKFSALWAVWFSYVPICLSIVYTQAPMYNNLGSVGLFMPTLYIYFSYHIEHVRMFPCVALFCFVYLMMYGVFMA